MPTALLPTAVDLTPTESVVENLERVRARIRDVVLNARRSADDVTLIAVSKIHDAARIEQARDAGQRQFGENRIQEADGKWPARKAAEPACKLRLIGHLQTNKVKEAVSFDLSF